MNRSITALQIRSDVFADGDLDKRLRLFVLAAVHLWETKDARRELGEFRKEPWPIRALRMSGETGTLEEVTGRLRWLIYDDVPKYRLDMRERIVCCGTMQRPAGKPCTKKPTIQTTIPHPFTGERAWHGACGNPSHRAKFESERKAGWAAWNANGEPEPQPNSGGLLLRYFNSGIEPLYAWADERYKTGATVTQPPRTEIANLVYLDDRRRPADTREGE